MKTERELKEYAAAQSKTIVIRSYNNGNSSDDERPATEAESKIIFAIIYGALLTINRGEDKQTAKDAAEFIGDIQLPSMNGYDTIYNRIGAFDFGEKE